MKKGIKVFDIYASPYGEYIEVIQEDDVEKVISYIGSKMADDYSDSWKQTVYDTYNDDEGLCYVSTEENMHWLCLRGKTGTDIWTASAILHECLHLTNNILYRRGLHLSPETDEAFCYLQQWLFKEVYAGILKKAIRPPKKK